MAVKRVRVNSRELSWNSVIYKIDGQRTEAITAISWAEKRDRPLVRGARRDGRPMGRTSGKYDPGTVKVTMFLSDWVVWRSDLAARGNGSYAETEFTMHLQLVEPGLPVSNTRFDDCVITIPGASYSEGDEPAKIDLEISTMGIDDNGTTLYRREN